MYHHNEQALSRPKNVFDLPALTIHALASTGRAAVRLAYALDSVRANSSERSRGGPRSSEPSVGSAERSALGESWRIK